MAMATAPASATPTADPIPKSGRPTEHAKPTPAVARLLRAIPKSPARSGKWTTAPVRIPTFAIHMAMLPSGKVLAWGYPPANTIPRPNSGQAFLWDPRKGTGKRSIKEVDPPLMDANDDGVLEPTPLYCSGMSFLADGELLLVGGNKRWPDDLNGQDFNALRVAHTFNPWSEKWTVQPVPATGRWYPGQVRIQDGRSVILGGYNELEPGGVQNTLLETFTAGPHLGSRGTFTSEPQGDRKTALYPHLIAWANGGALLAGPARGDMGLLDPVTMTWSPVKAATRNRVGGAAVLMPGGPDGSRTVMQVGGYDPNDQKGDSTPATGTTESLTYPAQATARPPKWRLGTSMKIPRSYMNTLILPTGDLLTVGGGKGKYGVQQNYAYRSDGASKHVEIRDHRTGRWRLGAAQREIRAYHSTAVLLPDGRVLSAGDDYSTSNKHDTAEVYSPPYLFRPDRPKIVAAPQQIHYGQRLRIRVNGAIRKVVLTAPGSITHAAEVNARLIELRHLGGVGAISATAPSSGAIAPSG